MKLYINVFISISKFQMLSVDPESASATNDVLMIALGRFVKRRIVFNEV